MARILLATNGSGFQIDKCMNVDSFRSSIAMLVSDCDCPALQVASRHGVDFLNLNQRDGVALNREILCLARERAIDYIISPGFTRLFRPELLDAMPGRVFNCHPSILPAFPGYYDTRDHCRNYPARKIFERTLEYNSRLTGNTIHLVNALVDDGCPLLVSSFAIPYDEDPRYTRHRLFLQECKCLLQLVFWMCDGRIVYEENRVRVKDAIFAGPEFAPALDASEALEFDLSFPWE